MNKGKELITGTKFKLANYILESELKHNNIYTFGKVIKKKFLEDKKTSYEVLNKYGFVIGFRSESIINYNLRQKRFIKIK